MNDFLSVRSYSKTKEIQLKGVEVSHFVYITSGNARFDSEAAILNKGNAAYFPNTDARINFDVEFSAIVVTVKNCDLPNKFIVISDTDELSVLRTFAEIGRFNNRAIKKRALIVKSLCALLVAYFVCLSGEGDQSVVGTIKAVIDENYFRTSFKIDEYLKSLPFSYDYLRKAFKKEIGTSPLEYLTIRRIDLAKSMLSSNPKGYSIGEIAEKCGYSDALYFSRVFKKCVGVSPRAYLNDKCE